MATWQEQALSIEPRAANLEGLLKVVFYIDDDGVPEVSYQVDGEVRVGRIAGDLFHVAHDIMHQAGAEDDV